MKMARMIKLLRRSTRGRSVGFGRLLPSFFHEEGDDRRQETRNDGSKLQQLAKLNDCKKLANHKETLTEGKLL